MSGTIEPVINVSAGVLTDFSADFLTNVSINDTDVDQAVAAVTGLPVPEVWVAVGFLGTAAAVGTANNLLVVFAFLTTSKVRTSANALVFNLSLADLLLSGLVQPFLVFSLVTGSWPYSTHLCRFLAALTYLCQVVVASSSALIAVNRYIFVVRSLNCYKNTFTPLKTAGMAMLSWVVGGLMILPPLAGWSRFGWNADWSTCEIEEVNPETYGYVSFCVIIVLIAYLVTGFLYQRVYSHVKASAIRSMPNAHPKVIAKKTIQKTKNLFIICCIFFVFWLPGALVFLIDYNASFTPRAVHFGLWVLYNFNQAINPVLYAFKIKDFRTAILGALGCRRTNQVLPVGSPEMDKTGLSPFRTVVKPDEIELNPMPTNKTSVLVVSSQ